MVKYGVHTELSRVVSTTVFPVVTELYKSALIKSDNFSFPKNLSDFSMNIISFRSSIAFIREIGPVLTALICAGKVGSGIGAELGSMKVTEQIDAMEVSGTNPFKFLVVSRVWACIIMLPLLVIAADTVGLFGSFLIEWTKGNISLDLYFNRVFLTLLMGDIVPATVKSFFFGLVIGIVGCYKGYHSDKGTEGVGRAANTAVVLASLLLFIVDFLAVLIADIFYVI